MMMSDRFVELRHQLHDHAEDYERLTRSHQASTLGTQGDETSGSIQRSRVDENDPLFMVQEQLNQQVRDRAFASSCVTTAHICSEHLVEFGMWLIVSYVWHRKG